MAIRGTAATQAAGGGGTVTSVTATSPITSSGGATPNISTSIATARLVGRTTAGAGVMEQLTVGTGLLLSAGSLSSTITQYTDEMAQDAVGGILTDSSEIDFTYADATPSITAALVATAVTPASYGAADKVGAFTVDSKGRLTAASDVPIAIPSTAVTDFDEAAQDAVAAMISNTTYISLNYIDANPELTAILDYVTLLDDIEDDLVADGYLIAAWGQIKDEVAVSSGDAPGTIYDLEGTVTSDGVNVVDDADTIKAILPGPYALNLSCISTESAASGWRGWHIRILVNGAPVSYDGSLGVDSGQLYSGAGGPEMAEFSQSGGVHVNVTLAANDIVTAEAEREAEGNSANGVLRFTLTAQYLGDVA